MTRQTQADGALRTSRLLQCQGKSSYKEQKMEGNERERERADSKRNKYLLYANSNKISSPLQNSKLFFLCNKNNSYLVSCANSASLCFSLHCQTLIPSQIQFFRETHFKLIPNIYIYIYLSLKFIIGFSRLFMQTIFFFISPPIFNNLYKYTIQLNITCNLEHSKA